MFLSSCNSGAGISKDGLKKLLAENPDILVEAIEKNPEKILTALQKAASGMRETLAKKAKDKEKLQLEASFDKPLVPVIRKDESIRGTKGGPITIVEYSDFQCPFCSRGFKTVLAILNKYKGKVQFIYKHLPLDFHPQALIASQYYEAIRLQDELKAFKFHDLIFARQGKLRNGKKFLDGLAKEVGADMAKLTKDYNSDFINNRIKDDMKEAAKFGFQGTPGFLLNGVPIRGALPPEYFENIVNELKKRGKITL